jgi:hypothetical protein
MARISDDARGRNEDAVRAAIDRMLRGELPPGGELDLKTLAAEAGVTRTGFYPKRNRDGSERPGPYQYLAEEFKRRLRALQAAGEVVDPREAQIERLKAEVDDLKKRIAKRDADLAELKKFQVTALSQLTAQHEEIARLREQAATGSNVATLPTKPSRGIGP